MRKTNILVISLGIKTKYEFTKGSNVFSRLVKKLLHGNGIEIFNDEKWKKSVIAEIFIRTLSNQIYMDMTAICKQGTAVLTLKLSVFLL